MWAYHMSFRVNQTLQLDIVLVLNFELVSYNSNILKGYLVLVMVN